MRAFRIPVHALRTPTRHWICPRRELVLRDLHGLVANLGDQQANLHPGTIAPCLSIDASTANIDFLPYPSIR